MPFQRGNTLGAKSRRALKALDLALSSKGSDDIALRRIMDKVIELATEGERWAVEFIADRLDGKPAQTIDANITDNRSEEREATVARIFELIAANTQKDATHKGNRKVN